MHTNCTHHWIFLGIVGGSLFVLLGWPAAMEAGSGGLDPHEVTNAQYARFIAATGHAAPPHWSHGTPPVSQAGEPVVMINWHDAVAYCAWDGNKKLPTVVEWQAACHASEIHKLGDVWEWTATNAEGEAGAKILCGPRGTCECGHVYDPTWRNMVKGFRCGGSQPLAFRVPVSFHAQKPLPTLGE